MDNKLLTSIIDFLPDATFVIDKEKKVIAWNRAIEEMTGIGREGIIGKGDCAYAFPFYNEKKTMLVDLVIQENGEAEGQYRYVKKRGNIIYAEGYAPALNNGKGAYLRGTAAPLLDDKGNCQGAIESIRDITDTKEALEALKQSEEKFRLLFEKSVDPILLLDNGVYTDCNDASLKLMGCSGKNQLIGLKPSDISPERQPDGRLSTEKSSELTDVAFKKGAIRFEWMRRTFDGKDIWVETSLTAIPIHGRQVVYTVWRDITERKSAEEELKKREAELDIKSTNLEEMNAALKVLLKERENDKTELEEKILSNIRELILPYIERLKKCRLDAGHMTYVNIIETNLNDVVSPFLQKMSLKLAHLTPTEIQIANLIKNGSTTKEISLSLNMSSGAINFHRNNIRKKLGLNKSKANLRSYLVTL